MRRITKKVAEYIERGVWWEVDSIYILYQQIFGLLRPYDPAKYRFLNAKSSRTILVIPGVFESWQIMRPVADMLVQAGYRVHVLPELGYNVSSVEDAAEIVSSYIRQKQLSDCVLVTHSKGGLIGKYLLSQPSLRSSLRGMIAINTPFSGTPFVRFLPTQTLRMFLATSATITSLQKDLATNARITSMFSKYDPLISSGSSLEGATNITLPTIGHFVVLRDKQVHARLLSELENYFSAKESVSGRRERV